MPIHVQLRPLRPQAGVIEHPRIGYGAKQLGRKIGYIFKHGEPLVPAQSANPRTFPPHSPAFARVSFSLVAFVLSSSVVRRSFKQASPLVR